MWFKMDDETVRQAEAALRAAGVGRAADTIKYYRDLAQAPKAGQFQFESTFEPQQAVLNVYSDGVARESPNGVEVMVWRLFEGQSFDASPPPAGVDADEEEWEDGYDDDKEVDEAAAPRPTPPMESTQSANPAPAREFDAPVARMKENAERMRAAHKAAAHDALPDVDSEPSPPDPKDSPPLPPQS